MWISITSWIWKFLGGIIPLGTKPFGEWSGKILWAVVIFSLCTGFMNFLLPRKPNGENITSKIVYEEKQDVARIGCNMWKGYVRVGYSK